VESLQTLQTFSGKQEFTIPGSKFYENEKKKDAQLTRKLQKMKDELNAASAGQLAGCKNKVGRYDFIFM